MWRRSTSRLPTLSRRLAVSPQRRALSTSPVAAAVAAPLTFAQTILTHVHDFTGAPWWLTIGGGALALRVAILPAVYYQLRETRRLLLLRPHLLKVRQDTEAIAAPHLKLAARIRGMHAVCVERGVRPWRVVALPLAQIPLLLTLVVAVRRMLLPDSPWADALASGGALWFHNLTSADPTAALPVLSMLALLANFQLAAHGGRLSILYGVRNVLQAGSVVMLPMYAELPAGVFMYLLPNSTFSLVQTLCADANVSGSDEEAEWRRRIAADPLDIPAHVDLSKALLRLKRADAAVAHLWPAVQQCPREASGPLRFQLGLAMSLQGQHDVAQPLFEQVLELEEDFVEAWLCLASARTARGEAEGAAEALERAATLKPELRSFVDREKERVAAAAAAAAKPPRPE